MSAELHLHLLDEFAYAPPSDAEEAVVPRLRNRARAKVVASFGENLRHAREARNITLQEIAASTKISTRALQALENEHFEQLPGGIFNRGFVRAYARCVGLDEENAVAEYLAAAKAAPAELDMQTMSSQVVASGMARQQWAPNAATVVGILAIIVALGLGGMSLKEHRKEAREQAARHLAEVLRSTATPAPAVQPQAVSGQSVAPQSAQSTSQGAPLVAASEAPAATGASPATMVKAPTALPATAVASNATAAVEVLISATARAWISVRSDGKTVESVTLDPEKPELRTRSYTAKEKLTLEVGNPGALSVTYNGKPTGTLGPSGQRATITFTPEGIEKQ